MILLWMNSWTFIYSSKEVPQKIMSTHTTWIRQSYQNSVLFKNIAHCITSSTVSTFCECQFHITLLSAHSLNISFALQCCQHVLWMSVLYHSAVSMFYEHQFCITVLSACSVNVKSCCIFYKTALHHKEQNSACPSTTKAQQSIFLPGYTAVR